MQAIFMVGEQRSGSNLLRLILNQSHDIAAPHPPHILQRMMPLLPVYGDLQNKKSFRKLVDDVCKLVELNPVPWDNMQLDRKLIEQRCNEHSLIAVYAAVMDSYAETHHARSWLCKSMQNIYWADEINRYFDNPKYIYLYRDPRDVALSFSKAVIGEKHPYFIARQWAELQSLCLQQQEQSDSAHFFALSYENLLKHPETVVRNLCQFLQTEFSMAMLDFHRSSEAERSAKSSTLWKNLSQPLNTNNSRKFISEMSSDNIRIIESVCGDIMDRLGYERVLVQKGEEQIFSQQQIETFKQQNEEAKQKKSQQVDPADRQRRAQQTGFLQQISQRVT